MNVQKKMRARFLDCLALHVPDEGYSRSVPDEGYSRSVPDKGYSRSVPDEGYSRTVPDEGYSRNTSCTLNLISKFFVCSNLS